MSINTTREQLKGMNRTYNLAVKNQNALEWTSSKLYEQDFKLIDYFETDINNYIRDFMPDLYKLYNSDCPDKYTKTLSKLESLYNAVQDGNHQIQSYKNTVVEKSREVFDEYTQEFNKIQNQYSTCERGIENYINCAEEADAEAKKLRGQADNSEEANSLLSQASAYEEKRDMQLDLAESSLKNLGSYLDTMREILEKGLQKVA